MTNNTVSSNITSEDFLRRLTMIRARRTGTFITDRGFRHISHRRDKSGGSYAFWYVPFDRQV